MDENKGTTTKGIGSQTNVSNSGEQNLKITSLEVFVHDSIQSFSMAIVSFEKVWNDHHRKEPDKYPVSMERARWSKHFNRFIQGKTLEGE